MISEGKNLTTEQAIEFANMATLYVNKDKLKSDKFAEWLVGLWSTWLWASHTGPKSDTKSKEFGSQVFWGKFWHLYK